MFVIRGWTHLSNNKTVEDFSQVSQLLWLIKGPRPNEQFNTYEKWIHGTRL